MGADPVAAHRAWREAVEAEASARKALAEALRQAHGDGESIRGLAERLGYRSQNSVQRLLKD